MALVTGNGESGVSKSVSDKLMFCQFCLHSIPITNECGKTPKCLMPRLRTAPLDSLHLPEHFYYER